MIAEQLLLGLKTTVLGMGVVFIGLIILQLIIALLARLSPTEESVPSAGAQARFIEGDESDVSDTAGPVQGEPETARGLVGVDYSAEAGAAEEVAAIAAALALVIEQGRNRA